MSKTHAITCLDCGYPYETKRVNTKYCRVCRLIKTILFIKTRTKKCWVCDKPFSPLDADRILCGDCEAPRGKNQPPRTCSLCKAEDKQMIDNSEQSGPPECHLDVCVACALNPKNTRGLLHGLHSRRAARQEAFGAPTPDAIAATEARLAAEAQERKRLRVAKAAEAQHLIEAV